MADDPLEELSRDEKQALVNLVKNDNGFDLSRRDVLALAGGASLGAVLGGTGYSAMGSAKADASTSDSDGNVGLPNDPVDAWIEGLAGPTGSPIDLGSDIVPDTDASYDLGSSSNQFANAHMSNAEVGSLTDASSGTTHDVDALHQWTDTGNGEIVPTDGEKIGDGTTTASHGSLSVGGQPSGLHWERLAERRLTGVTENLSLDGYDTYKIFYHGRHEGKGDTWIRLNGDGSGNGNYGFWDQNGSKTTGADEMLVYTETTSGHGDVAGEITLTQYGTRGVSIYHTFGAAYWSRVSNYTQGGGREVNERMDSLEFKLAADPADFELSLYGGSVI